jgi:hypothetical protein
MLKLSLTLPIILSALYVSFSQAQSNLSTCVLSCANAEASQTGCNMCVFSICIILHPYLIPPSRIAELIRQKRHVSVLTTSSPILRSLAWWRTVPPRMLKRVKPIGNQCASDEELGRRTKEREWGGTLVPVQRSVLRSCD